MKSLPQVSSKTCGQCHACCIVVAVDEISKPKDTKCPHLSGKPLTKRSCTIYETRPVSCQTYECLWLSSDMPEKFRPDKVGLILEVQTPSGLGVEMIVAKETVLDASESEDGFTLLQRLVTGAGYPIAIRRANKSYRFMLRPEDTELAQKIRQISQVTEIDRPEGNV